MHKTAAGERAKALKKEAQDLARRAKAQKEASATMRAAGVYSNESSIYGCQEALPGPGSPAGGQAGGSPCMGAKEGKGYQGGDGGLHLLYGLLEREKEDKERIT